MEKLEIFIEEFRELTVKYEDVNCFKKLELVKNVSS